MQVGRNITRIKLLVREFLEQQNETQWVAICPFSF
jgi:hypothetical protein